MVGTEALLAVVLILGVSAYPNGAPEKACNSMMPQHGADPLKSKVPYKVTCQAKDRDRVQIVIEGGFRGLLLKVQLNGTDVSAFAEPGEHFHTACRGTAVTHSNSDRKQKTTFLAKVPDNSATGLKCVLTVVEKKDRFWVKKTYNVKAAPESKKMNRKLQRKPGTSSRKPNSEANAALTKEVKIKPPKKPVRSSRKPSQMINSV